MQIMLLNLFILIISAILFAIEIIYTIYEMYQCIIIRCGDTVSFWRHGTNVRRKRYEYLATVFGDEARWLEIPFRHYGRYFMGSATDKIKGLANEATGNVKQVAGRVLDKPSLEAEGAVQERKGEAQQMLGKAKDAVKKVIDKG